MVEVEVMMPYAYVAEPDDHSQLVYSSDDSSLNDAYFLGRAVSPPLTYSPDQKPAADSLLTLSKQQYGSLMSVGSSQASLQASPLLLDLSTMSILEDSPDVYQPSTRRANGHPPPRILTQQLSKDLSLRARQQRRKQRAREMKVNEVRGQVQPEEWRDVISLYAFVIHLMIIVFCAVRFGAGAFTKTDWIPRWSQISVNDDVLYSGFVAEDTPQTLSTFKIDYRNVLQVCGITGFYAIILSTLTVGFMLIIAKSLIQTALVFSILICLAGGVIGLALQPNGIIPIVGFMSLGLTVLYTFYVWDRIPFAATNLNTALMAMRCTADITSTGMVMMVVAFCWCIVWILAFIGVVDTFEDSGTSKAAFIFLVFSFCWTNLVIKNIVQVTVASAVGCWWFEPDSVHPCCSPTVAYPFGRSISSSLGSICLGSLLVIPSQIISGFCSLCILPSQIFRKSNRWAFTYIGMYGYNFFDSSENALRLFETREWTAVVHDNLIHTVLLMASVVIGGSTGTFGVLVEEVDGFQFTSFHKPVSTAFVIGATFGFVLSNVLLLGVVGSAVNTILVCFAAGPFEFHKNHPRLSQEMRDVWSQQVWEPSPV